MQDFVLFWHSSKCTNIEWISAWTISVI